MDSTDIAKHCDGYPSFMPRSITSLGFLPLTDIFAKGPTGRKVNLSTVCHVLYWTACFIFMAIEVSSSAYIMAEMIAVPKTDNPLLMAFLEASFAFEMYRGPIFCIIILTHCKAGIRLMVQETERLVVCFMLSENVIRKIRRMTTALLVIAAVTIIGIAGIICTRWHFVHPYTMNIKPYFALPTDLVIALITVFSFTPELLARFTLVLVFGSGMVLLACVKVMKSKVCEKEGMSLHGLQRARCQYYALAKTLSAITESVGGVMAFSILADFVPICGRATRWFFTIPAETTVGKLDQRLADYRSAVYSVVGIVFHLIVMYSPFVLLHREAGKMYSKLLSQKRELFTKNPSQQSEELNELDNLLHDFGEQPLVLTLLPGFQIRENFVLMIATVLSSYVIICYQLLKDSSHPLAKSDSMNCTSF
ncbi:hypothetical protein BV898_18567 [Hypsibius exemplaris]|uniref:Uncharacterized protein n=1 Tax=Hypsibius exemplaris TaxID=2072580 RepID=A0A9X6NJY0_HYPEX|nr:hypothetical protein BV898_18567 [Hypsibius exemplaris]